MKSNQRQKARALRADAQAAVDEFQDTLHRITAITARQKIEDKELSDTLTSFRSIVRERVQLLGSTLEAMLGRAEWDRMNVGFFGETQHGKSTLIESLTRGDGASIGTGRKDHTREVNARSIRGLRVLDLPGIEGNEDTVMEQITAGLQRSHVILHVIPADKAPEQPTIERVRSHLRNEVVVFALINVFGSPGDFRELTPLRDLKARQIEEIERCFREQMGSAFKGSFVVAGRLAHATAARGELSEKVEKDRAKTEAIFPSLLAARRYSGLSDLERGLRDLRERHFPTLPVLTALRLAGELVC